LFLAFVCNAVGIPVAGGALYPLLGVLLSAMLASAAMNLSSVSVMANALRLRRARVVITRESATRGESARRKVTRNTRLSAPANTHAPTPSRSGR
jgi:hypothetical protein